MKRLETGQEHPSGIRGLLTACGRHERCDPFGSRARPRRSARCWNPGLPASPL